MNFLQNLFQNLFVQSNGLKRSIASVLAVAAYASQFVPAAAPYQSALLEAAALFGGTGVAHATLAK